LAGLMALMAGIARFGHQPRITSIVCHGLGRIHTDQGQAPGPIIMARTYGDLDRYQEDYIQG
jgi:hypothetical protein